MSAVCAGGPYCAVPVLVRPRPARSRLVRWPALSVCHFSASGYRRRRGALLDPVCLFERLMRLTDAGGAFALHRTTEHWSQRAICFFCWPNGQFSAWPPPGAASSIRGHDGDGQSRADATATATPRIPPPVPQCEIDSMSGSQSESPRGGHHRVNITKAWLDPRSIYLSKEVVQDTHQAEDTQALTQQQSRAWWSNNGLNFGALALVDGSAWPCRPCCRRCAVSPTDLHTPRGSWRRWTAIAGEESGFAGSLNGRPKTEVPQNEFPLVLRHPPRRAPGGGTFTQVSASHRSAREAKKKGVCHGLLPSGTRLTPTTRAPPKQPRKTHCDHGTHAHGQLDKQASKSHLNMSEELGFPARLTLLPVAVARGKKAYTRKVPVACAMRMHTPCRDPAHRVRREEKSGMPAGLPGSHRGG